MWLGIIYRWIAKLFDKILSVRTSGAEEICKIRSVLCHKRIVNLSYERRKVHRHFGGVVNEVDPKLYHRSNCKQKNGEMYNCKS